MASVDQAVQMFLQQQGAPMTGENVNRAKAFLMEEQPAKLNQLMSAADQGRNVVSGGLGDDFDAFVARSDGSASPSEQGSAPNTNAVSGVAPPQDSNTPGRAGPSGDSSAPVPRQAPQRQSVTPPTPDTKPDMMPQQGTRPAAAGDRPMASASGAETSGSVGARRDARDDEGPGLTPSLDEVIMSVLGATAAGQDARQSQQPSEASRSMPGAGQRAVEAQSAPEQPQQPRNPASSARTTTDRGGVPSTAAPRQSNVGQQQPGPARTPNNDPEFQQQTRNTADAETNVVEQDINNRTANADGALRRAIEREQGPSPVSNDIRDIESSARVTAAAEAINNGQVRPAEMMQQLGFQPAGDVLGNDGGPIAQFQNAEGDTLSMNLRTGEVMLNGSPTDVGIQRMDQRMELMQAAQNNQAPINRLPEHQRQELRRGSNEPVDPRHISRALGGAM